MAASVHLGNVACPFHKERTLVCVLLLFSVLCYAMANLSGLLEIESEMSDEGVVSHLCRVYIYSWATANGMLL